jgi:hypothetical protein
MNGVTWVLWLMTAVGGLYMAAVSMRSGNRQSAATTTNLPRGLIFVHGTLALLGLVAWAVYARYGHGNTNIGWAMFGVLVLVVLGGLTLFSRWLRDRRDLTSAERGRLAEHDIPPVAVTLHGGLAVLTVAAVLIALLA